MNKIKDKAGKAISFWTAGSKKIILSMTFLVSVIVDEIWLDNAIYTKDNILASNVFKGICATVAIILTKDLQNILNKFLNKE